MFCCKILGNIQVNSFLVCIDKQCLSMARIQHITDSVLILYMFCNVQQMCSYSECANVLSLKFFNLNSKFSILTPNSYYIIKLYPMYICCRLSDLFKDFCHSSTHNFSQFLMIPNDVFWKVKNVKSTSTVPEKC